MVYQSIIPCRTNQDFRCIQGLDIPVCVILQELPRQLFFGSYSSLPRLLFVIIFRAAPSQWQLKNSATRWTIVAFTWFSHVFTVFTRFIPCFTVILPLSYHHISPLSSPQDSDTADRAELWIFLGHDVVSVLASACATLPWSNRVAGRWGVHAACTAWGLDHWDWMMLRWCWYWSFS